MSKGYLGEIGAMQVLAEKIKSIVNFNRIRSDISNPFSSTEMHLG